MTQIKLPEAVASYFCRRAPGFARWQAMKCAPVNLSLASWLSVLLACSTAAGESVQPGQLVNYEPLAFRPKVWAEKHVSTFLIPWAGSNIVFLTTNGTYDPVLMTHWVTRLDQGWQLYADLTGTRPKALKQLDGRVTVAAVPGFDFTCGAGCGYVGSSGIELAMFYGWNYPALRKNTNAMPHYIFYEMGRNFFTFGDRHSAFTTGYAVFMRYVCMDTLGCVDEDLATRHTIEGVEPLIRSGELPFLKTFTNMDGLSEKEARVLDRAGGKVHPSDQPVTYASAMLRLRRENGGNDWVARFCRAMAQCPSARGQTREAALAQSWNWLVAASVAAHKDLTPVFVDDWRLPLAAETRRELALVKWSAQPSTAAILEQIKPRWLDPAEAADSSDLFYLPGSTKKVGQLTGDFDRGLQRPTLSQTGKRYGVTGTDLGSSFEHEGRLYFLFGDTFGRPGDWDALAWTTNADPERIVLDFHRDQDGKWLPPKVPGISQKGFEIPSGGVSVAGTIYVVFTTDHSRKTVMGRSVLAASADEGRSFTHLYDLSRDKFINVSICAADGWLYIYGSGKYRESSVCLARVRPGDIRDRTKLHYFTGPGPDGQARWAGQETNATTLFHHDVVGEFSVTYLEPVKRYVMLYNHNVGQPRGIIMRSAAEPSGPWSEGVVIFEPWRDAGFGQFMHIPAKASKETDALSDPKRDNVEGAEYGPYVMDRFTSGSGGECRIYYTMSTWNPYQVVVMRSDLSVSNIRKD